MYEKINEPLSIRGLKLKNRIVFAPTTMGLSEEEYLERLGIIAAGGAAMLVIGDVPVLRHSLFAKSLYSTKGFEFYRRVTEVIHKNGAKACAQLHVSDSDIKGMLRFVPGMLMKRITPDRLRELMNERTGPYITGIPESKIGKITASFGDAAVLAGKASFDMIQVHGDRMCGSFSSSVFNHRTDSYGASAANRAKFACECIAAVRQALPDMPVEYKLAVRQENPHYGNAGILVEELPVFLPLLEKAGVDSYHVALADHSSLSDTIPPKSHPYFSGEGCFLKYCDEVKKYSSLPVCAVGGLTNPDFVEEQLTRSRIDYAAMSRQLIADPEWPNKTAGKNQDKIRFCVRCNRECLGGMMEHRGVHCIYDKKKEDVQ